MNTKLPLNFILSFCKEMVPDHGEDSYCYAFCDIAGLVGVFDGCGGAGARKHPYYSDATEAYVASRLCAGVFYDQFRKHFPALIAPGKFVSEALVPGVKHCLDQYQPPKQSDSFEIRGSMVRTLPTTAAAALIQAMDDDEILVSPIWAGDSRVYILDARGLAQLTVDDTSVPDPMENLYEDGVLKNVLCSGRPVNLHCRSVRMRAPFLAIAATDGCFGYLSTPMEFEGAILRTLLSADSVDQWEKTLAAELGSVAGDDHTLCIAGFGYRDLQALKSAFVGRYEKLCADHLDKIATLPIEDRKAREALWATYRENYCRYMKDGTS